MSAQRAKADYVFLGYIALLLLFGLLMLTSAGAAVGYDRFGDRYFFVKRQLLYGIVPGLIAFFVMARIRYQIWRRYAMPIFVGMIALLLLVFLPGIGSTLNTGARSWLVFGNYTLQPAEFAKFGTILFLSTAIAAKGAAIKDVKKGFLYTLAFGLLPVILVMVQPDVGTASILFAIVFGLLFIAGAQLKHMVGLALAGIAAFGAMVVIAPYRAARLMTFLHPELDPLGIGYHINQAFLAIGSGGWFGLGYGHSRQKFEYLPEVHADSIFAIVAEELGVVIAVAFVVLLVLIAIRGLRIAKNAPDQFGRLLASGIILWFMVQAFFNIGAMIGLMPLTGVPLPLVSHGGTALMIAMAAIGLLVNISKQVKQ